MYIETRIKSNVYYDSLVLMQLSTKLQVQPGVRLAVAMMATEENKASLKDEELLTQEVRLAKPNDLFVVVGADRREATRAAIEYAVDYLENWRTTNRPTSLVYRSVDAALRNTPGANLVAISVPGRYAASEARRALEAGLHIFLFSDNVPLESEVELKRLAAGKRRLVMGPDCGTAILQGAGLGFANAVRRGPIGVVGASGTGIQEVTSLVHRWGSGISQAIGTGSRDVNAEIGGATLKAGLEWLLADRGTRVVVIISKPGSHPVMHQVQEIVARSTKPVVVSFLGDTRKQFDVRRQSVWTAGTLEEAARMAVALVGNGSSEASIYDEAELVKIAEGERAKLRSDQEFFRGLFSGGTFAAESAMLLAQSLPVVFSNIAVPGVRRLGDPVQSFKHTVVDMGDDFFTIGKPHPMLEPSLRRARLMAEASDSTTGVIVLDIVLGYGAHPDPAGEFAGYIWEAKELAGRQGYYLPIVVNVCGVDEDPQKRSAQVEKLEASGARVAPTNASATRLALGILTGVFPPVPAPPIITPFRYTEQAAVRGTLSLPDRIHVINVGLHSFASALEAQGVPVTEVDFRPPAGGQETLVDLLAEML